MLGEFSPLPAGERSILAPKSDVSDLAKSWIGRTREHPSSASEDRVRGLRFITANNCPIPLTPSLSPPGRGSRLRPAPNQMQGSPLDAGSAGTLNRHIRLFVLSGGSGGRSAGNRAASRRCRAG